MTVIVSLAALAACGGGGGGSSGVTPPPGQTPTRVEDQLGTAFGTTFRADPNTEARDPAAGDVNPVNFTAEPIAVP